MNVHYAQYREMKGMRKMREFVIFLAVLKLGSYSSSQYLRHLVCYILHIFGNNTHTNAINTWLDHMKMRARNCSHT